MASYLVHCWSVAATTVELGAATGQSAQPMVEKPTQAEGADASE